MKITVTTSLFTKRNMNINARQMSLKIFGKLIVNN